MLEESEDSDTLTQSERLPESITFISHYHKVKLNAISS
jgi:hypothetical protein